MAQEERKVHVLKKRRNRDRDRLVLWHYHNHPLESERRALEHSVVCDYASCLRCLVNVMIMVTE